MTSRKKAKMGADPLAWMQDNDTSPVRMVTSKPVERRKKPRSKKPTSGLQVDLLEQIFAVLVPQGEALVKRFYAELFERYPDIKPMFANTTVAEQEKQLLVTLQRVVNSLRKPGALARTLTDLGSQYHEYGAKPEHYTAVAETLLDVMAEFASELWTDDVYAAWREALNTVATTMLAAEQTDNTGEEDKTMAASKKVVNEKIQEDAAINADFASQIAAISKSQAVIEFNMDGTIIQANDNFLNTLGYRLEEIQGKHHRMFVESDYTQSMEYARFWEKLNAGEFESGRYKRLGKGGREVWIEASYNPILDLNGQPFKVVKYATDVTESMLKEADSSGQINAISKNQAVIEFNMDGTITQANDNFLNTLGYSLDEIQGKHHRMFVEPGYAQSPEYIRFWEKLNAGEYEAARYKRLGKGGREVWIQASYNPIFDLNGKPFKVVKYATDVTAEKNAEHQIQGLIDGAVAGQLDNRITTDQFEGFLRNVGEGINRLMDAVTEPVQETRRVISGLADGDLTQSMNGEFEGEFAELRDAVNATMNKLLSMVNEIGTASGTIASAANEISQGTADLSQRSEEQASSLEETASSMEELTGTVRQNADNAREANQLANGARDEASKGGQVVGKAITAMAEINQSSKKIADIIGVIDEIAFQTNLLALNAAVEAARAGEQGRGFAVVAAEVRNLAQRSASAAKEIKSLINDSVEKVTEGSKLVDQSGATLEEIVGSVKKVSDIIAEIASAGQEQASGIDQINKAVTQMDEMTQQNAALVEEAAASSEAMNDQAVALDDLIGFFKTGDNTRRSAPSAQHAARPAAASPAPARRSASKDTGGSEWEEF